MGLILLKKHEISVFTPGFCQKWGHKTSKTPTDTFFVKQIHEKYAGRIVRLGLFKCSITVYNVGHDTAGDPFISGGEDLEIQNSKLKDFIMTRPMEKIDISNFKQNGYKE